jgi:excisionase family DNA binding protein
MRTRQNNKKVDGTPPGKKLSETSYSVRDVASMLEVDDETIYVRIRDGVLETYLAEGWMRITKESFQKWYGSQCKLRTEADKMLDSDAKNSSISLTDAARALGTHRNNIYDLIKRHPTEFEIITVAGRKRITRESFERWYNSQSRYHLKPCMESSQSSEPSRIEIETSEAVEDESAVGNRRFSKDERPFYTVEEIQLRMNLSKKEAYDLAQTGLFKVIRVGKRYFIPKDSFEEWLSISQIQKENNKMATIIKRKKSVSVVYTYLRAVRRSKNGKPSKPWPRQRNVSLRWSTNRASDRSLFQCAMLSTIFWMSMLLYTGRPNGHCQHIQVIRQFSTTMFGPRLVTWRYQKFQRGSLTILPGLVENESSSYQLKKANRSLPDAYSSA